MPWLPLPGGSSIAQEPATIGPAAGGKPPVAAVHARREPGGTRARGECRSAAGLAHHRGKRSIAFPRGLDVPLRPERIAAGSGDVPRPPTLYDQPVRLVDCPTRLIDRPPRLINQSTALAAVLVQFLG